MLYIIKCMILALVVIAGFAVAAGWVLGRFDEDEEEQCMCAITEKHCKYDYSVFAGGNPCDQCDIFEEWEDELNENCKTCGWSRFDELWGEYRCLARETSIPILMSKDECEFYNGDKAKVQKLIDEKNARRSRNYQAPL